MTPQKGPDRRDQPQNQDTVGLRGSRPPAYVVVTWVNEQLRDRLQRNGAALGDILRPRPEHLPVLDVDPQLSDREAEP